MDISLCMIVRDAEQDLEKCLNSCANVFNEIIIVDLGSSDRTREIARKYTGMLFDYPFSQDYSQARNFSFSKASSDFIMWLDASDAILPPDLGKLNNLKKVLPRDTDAVMMKDRISFNEKGHMSAYEYRERLVKRATGFVWQEPVHEYLPVTGNIRSCEISIARGAVKASDIRENLEIYNDMLSHVEELSPRNTLYYARDLLQSGQTDEAITCYEKYIGQNSGASDDRIRACIELSYCYEQQQNYDRMMGTLLMGLKKTEPCSELCCRIGDSHFLQKAYGEAIFWYDMAIKQKRTTGRSFMFEDYQGYIPSLQLCLCHYNMGNIQKSIEYNRIAKSYKPYDESVLNNEKFFAGRKRYYL